MLYSFGNNYFYLVNLSYLKYIIVPKIIDDEFSNYTLLNFMDNTFRTKQF